MTKICDRKSVLVLDKNYFPHKVVSWRRAMKLLYGPTEKAEVLEMYENHPTKYDVSVIRLVHRSLPHAFSSKKVKFFKKYLFIRDNYQCQYCGCERKELLTVDHVLPKCRGGPNTYQNCVTACINCNNWKGDKTPEEAGMRLASQPTTPVFGYLVSIHSAPDEWKKFLN